MAARLTSGRTFESSRPAKAAVAELPFLCPYPFAAGALRSVAAAAELLSGGVATSSLAAPKARIWQLAMRQCVSHSAATSSGKSAGARAICTADRTCYRPILVPPRWQQSWITPEALLLDGSAGDGRPRSCRGTRLCLYGESA